MAAQKRTHKYSLTSKKKSSIALILLIIFGIVFAFTCFRLIRSWQKKVWIPGERFTVVVATVNPKIYSYNPQNGKLVYFQIPKNTEVESSNGFGNYLSGNLWSLGVQEKSDGKVLQQSLQKSLGIPIDAWIEADGDKLFETGISGWFGALEQAVLSSSLKTNLTFFDRLTLLSSVQKAGLANRQEVNLQREGVIVPGKLSDGVDGYKIMPGVAKANFDLLRDDLVSGEGLKIVVLNSSDKVGLGSEVSQIISTLGVRVMSVQSDPLSLEDAAKYDNCYVLGNKKALESLSVKRLIQIFGCTTQVKTLTGAQDLELVLGSTFAKRF